MHNEKECSQLNLIIYFLNSEETQILKQLVRDFIVTMETLKRKEVLSKEFGG